MVGRDSIALLVHGEMINEARRIIHDDNAMDDELTCNHMLVHPYEGSYTFVSSSTLVHHAGRAVFVVIHATTIVRMSIALLIQGWDDHQVEQ